MTEKTEKWEDLDWFNIELEVFKLQKRIFRKSRQNRRYDVHKIQQLLVGSWFARCLAVRKAAEDSRGRKTPGIDGEANLTDQKKLKLANALSLQQRPQPVKRIHIPKPGSTELRPLGIPTIADRALQHLIVLALEPEWEAHFAPHQYGFRRGRGCHDALIHIRQHIKLCPKWILDADIEKFFDRLDHPALLKKIGTWTGMELAIWRILESGALEGTSLTPTDEGTPQGGPLSPLLANIALSSLEADIENAFPAGSTIGDTRLKEPPRTVLYADDLVVMHEHRPVVEAASAYIEEWLRPLGLNLSPAKTRITHTLEKVDGQQAGFDFLGCRVQQFKVGKYALTPYFKGIWTNIRPCHKGIRSLLRDCGETIRTMGPHKRRNAEYTQRIESGRAGPNQVMVILLNRKLRGWCGYHRHHNAKTTFSRIDHEVWKLLWHWAKRTFPRRGRRDLVDEMWLSQGRPWRFRVKSSSTGEPVELYSAGRTPIKRHIPVQADRSFFDGDWRYWGKRLGRYPGLPSQVGGLLKRQMGKCPICKTGIAAGTGRAVIALIHDDNEGSARLRRKLIHERCSEHLSNNAVIEDPFLDR